MREEQLEWRREKVEKFAARMQEMVAWKAGKGTWLDYKLSQAAGELMEEIGEVGKLLHKDLLTEEERKALQWECVDVAVSAMILADLVDTLPHLLGIQYPTKKESLLTYEEFQSESGYLVDQG